MTRRCLVFGATLLFVAAAAAQQDPIPEPLREWLWWEQAVNDKLASGIAIGSPEDNLPPQFDPKNRPVYRVPYVELPVNKARLFEAGALAPYIRSQLFVERGGKSYVRYFIHPASVEAPEFKKLMERHRVGWEYLGTPTSSPRSLAVWNPATGEPPMLVKASLDSTVGGLRRVISKAKAMRAASTTRALDAAYGPEGGPYFREPLVVLPRTREQVAMIVREPPASFPGENGSRWIPGSALVSRRPGGKPPILVDMIEKSGRPPVEFVRDRVLAPLMRTYGEITFRQGLVGEPHQQNALLEVDAKGELTGRVLLRDLDSYKIDVEARLRRGLPVRDLFPYGDRKLYEEMKLNEARRYYNTSYGSYLSDWPDAVSLGLKPHFPEATREALAGELDRLYAKEARRHLGVAAGEGFEPNKIVESFRRSRIGLPQTHGVSQEVLAAEFERLLMNERVFLAGGKLAMENGRYLLHDGAIELRSGGRADAIALLEPPGSGRDFYGRRPGARPPDPARLKSLYAGVARQRLHAAIGREAGEAGKFAAAYLLKEGIVALETGDSERMKHAVGALKTPEFWGSLAVFTAAARATEFGLAKLPVPGLARAALPLAVGMAAVQVMSGHASLRDVAIDTGAFLAAGLAVNLLADTLIYPALFAAGPPGWIAAGVYTVAKLAVTLYLGEKLGAWFRGLFDRNPKSDIRHPSDGLKQKIDELGGSR